MQHALYAALPYAAACRDWSNHGLGRTWRTLWGRALWEHGLAVLITFSGCNDSRVRGTWSMHSMLLSPTAHPCKAMEAYVVKMTRLLRGLVAFSWGVNAIIGGLVATSGGLMVCRGGLVVIRGGLMVFSGGLVVTSRWLIADHYVSKRFHSFTCNSMQAAP